MYMLDENKLYMIRLGNAIKARRISLGLSQEKLANELEIDRKHLSSIENGKQNMTFGTYFKICIGLDIDPLELFSAIKNERFN